MKLSVIGCGYLGAVHAAAMASIGHEVVGIDVDERKIAALSKGEAPFFEPGLQEILTAGIAAGNLRFTTDMADAAGAKVHFVGVGTPQQKDSYAADLTYVNAAFDGLLPYLAPGDIVAGKSTVPVGTAASLAPRVSATGATLVWNPEFLREGYAVQDTVDPDRLGFHSLDDMVTSIPNFEARWIHEQEHMRELWQQGDPAVREAYATTVAASRTSVPTFDYDPSVLARAYDREQTDSALRYVRDYVDKVAHRQFFAYRSLLSLRDVTGYLHDLRPHALKLTVSPKPENLAVLPVNGWSRVLPYHGVPVLTAQGRWEIAYFGDMAAHGPVEALHLAGDADPRPFAYRAAT